MSGRGLSMPIWQILIPVENILFLMRKIINTTSSFGKTEVINNGKGKKKEYPSVRMQKSPLKVLFQS